MHQTVNLTTIVFGGSNPSLPTEEIAGVTQLVESQPSKLLVAGSSPVSRSAVADVAQLVEHFLGKEEVTGSIPVISSESPQKQYGGRFCEINICSERQKLPHRITENRS